MRKGYFTLSKLCDGLPKQEVAEGFLYALLLHLYFLMRTILFVVDIWVNRGVAIVNNAVNLGSTGSDHVARQRDVYLDNVKGFLIACVVFGHMAIPVSERTNSLACIYKTIYLFHIPLFVFVSGYFSKSITKKGLRVDKICSMLILAFVYRILLQLSDSHITTEFFTKKIFYFGGAPWYLLSLATWYMLVPMFEKMKPLAAISLSILLSLCTGGYSQIGQVLSLSRTLVFLPYFLLGYYCNRSTLERIRNRSSFKLLITGVALLIIVYLICTHYTAFADTYYLVYGDSSYQHGFRNGVSYRIILALLACIISLIVICNAPSRSLPVITKLGENTLQIYIIHRLLRSSVAALGIYDMQAITNEFLAPIILLVVTIIVIAICMLPIFDVPVKWIMNDSGKLLTKSPSD